MIQFIVLWVAKATGLFAVARRLTANNLRILCYHGASLRDEHHFRPGLFMSSETFASRLNFLIKHGYPVISLDAAIDGLSEGKWPANATVITIDDGWYGSYAHMARLLKAHGYPATLYLASYYMERQTQVFNVAASYVLWRAREQRLDLTDVHRSLHGSYALADEEHRAAAVAQLSTYAESLNGAGPRQDLFRRLCAVLGIDARDIERQRICAFMDIEEVRRAQAAGIDIQLHSHRHRFPAECIEAARAEIDENRRALAPVSHRPLRHFCYPSGDYETAQLDWLGPLGIASATTVKRGLNQQGDSPYELRRFLDSEQVPLLEFEAEMSGFLELVRRCRYAT